MKNLSICILSFAIVIQIEAQTIKGYVMNASTNEPLEYVNIGIVDVHVGAVTNATGIFYLNVDNQSPESIVRFSMIGFKQASITIS